MTRAEILTVPGMPCDCARRADRDAPTRTGGHCDLSSGAIKWMVKVKRRGPERVKIGRVFQSNDRSYARVRTIDRKWNITFTMRLERLYDEKPNVNIDDDEEQSIVALMGPP